MSARQDPPGFGFVRFFARLVPVDRRRDWLAEWHSELTHGWAERADRGTTTQWTVAVLRLRAAASIRDAIALWRLHRSGSFAFDAHDALRTIRRQPGFLAAVVLTLGLGMGAATAIFTVVDALLLHPLPFVDPDRIVQIKGNRGVIDAALLDAVKAEDRIFESVRAYYPGPSTMTGVGEPRTLGVQEVEPGFLALLGLYPRIGRDFTDEEAVAGFDRVILLGDEVWRAAFGGDPGVLGQSVRLNGEPYTVIGVLPPTMRRVPEGLVGALVPLAGPVPAGASGVIAMARLRPRVPVAEAQARIDELAAWLDREQPRDAARQPRVVSLNTQGFQYERTALLALATGALFLLLVACANAAGLLFIRGLARESELVTRRALGATRGVLFRQLFVESLVMAGLAGLLGTLLAWWGVRGLLAIAPETIVRWHYNVVAVDGRALGFAFGLTIATGLAFGCLPAAWAARRSDVALRSVRTVTTSRSQLRARRVVQVIQLALAVLLLCGAGLLGRSFLRLLGVDPGFNASHQLRLDLASSPSRRDGGARQVFNQQLDTRLRAIPGVTGVAWSNGIGLQFTDVLQAEGDEPVSGGNRIIVSTSIDTAYIGVMGIPLLEGRVFQDQDTRPGSDAVIVDRDLAALLWPGRSAVGQRMRVDRGDPWLTVIGVANDAKLEGPDDRDRPWVIYHPASLERFGSYPSIAIRTAGDPAASSSAVRDVVHDIDPDLPIWHLYTARQRMYEEMAQPRFVLVIMMVFATLAVVLSAVGVYSLFAFSVKQRAREIGIRMALGARSGQVVAAVVRGGLAMALIGLMAGLAGALASSRFIESLLFGISPFDPATFASATAVLLLSCVVALAGPARRAAAIAPGIALRED
jgi:putative ABC transport system permease protein